MVLAKKGDVVWEHVVAWLLALLVLAVVIFSYFALTGKATGAVDFLKHLLRLRT